MQTWKDYTKEEQTRLINLQLSNEDRAAMQSINKYLHNVNHSPSSSPREKEFVFDYSNYLTEYLEWAEDKYKDVKKKPYWITIAQLLGPERCACIVVKVLLDSCLSSRLIQTADGIKYDSNNIGDFKGQTKQSVLSRIARELWLAIGIRQAKENFSEDFFRQSHYFKNWNKKRMKAFARKCKTLPEWDNKKRNVVALSFYALMVGDQESVMPFVDDTVTIVKNGQIKKYTVVTLRNEFTKNFEEFHAFYQYYKWLYYPMLAPPIPHQYPCSSPDQYGGSLNIEYRKSSIHNARAGSYHRNNSQHSQASVETLNNLQQTEWAVNKRVLECLENLYKTNNGYCNLPPYELDDFVFSEPFPEEGTREAMAQWKQKRSECWGEWEKSKQKRMQMEMRLLIARDLKDFVFWHAYSADFRGRAYTQSTLLSPQSGDFDAGLIQFSVPVDVTEKGLYWIKVNVANLWDQDKLSFDDRVKWTESNLEMLRKVAENPEETVSIWEDKKKKKNVSFRRLAATIDLFHAINDKKSYVPCHLDGTCNGIQHWVAAMLDETLAKYVNVCDTDLPGDMYKFIANMSTRKMQQEREENDYFDLFLTHWQETEDDECMPRSLPKRPVMCDPYGVTYYSARQYIRSEGHLDWCRDMLEPRGLSWQGAIVECTSVIWESLQEALVKPNLAKEYIKQCVEVCYNNEDKKKKPLEWVAPNGFKVRQYYTEHVEYITDIALLLKNDVRIRHTAEMWQFTDDMDPRKMTTAIPPNWVHSIDAAHMSMVVNFLARNGCSRFSMIHDSFGVPCNFIPMLVETVRIMFYEIHKENQLRKFKQSVENFVEHPIPEPPERGGLDPEEILRSTYLFC